MELPFRGGQERRFRSLGAARSRFFASAKFTGLEFIELIQRHPTIVFKFERLFKFKWGANVD
jgi:hypothetical protein